MKRTMILTVAVWSTIAGAGWSIDAIIPNNAKTVLGHINGITATTVSIQPMKTGEAQQDIPVNEIERITFENSPDALTAAQKSIINGEYEEALTSLKKIGPDESNRREVLEEIAFSKAYCNAQLAMTGSEDPLEAAKQMLAFLNNSPNSFHALKAYEMIGDLLVNSGRFAKAQEYYAKLAQAPWPDYKIRAQVALGRAFLAEKKIPEAAKSFKDALQINAAGPLADMQRAAAQIGQARCLAMSGNADKAVADLEQIVSRNDNNAETAALANNALGVALRKAGKPKEAILAFLHVHLQYAAQPDAHAEAVANLAKLFADTQKPDHARDMRKILDTAYVNSRWAKPGAVE